MTAKSELGWLQMGTWFYPVRIMSRAPKTCRVRLVVNTRLPSKWRSSGEIVRVPKFAVLEGRLPSQRSVQWGLP